jgi:MFS family permease
VVLVVTFNTSFLIEQYKIKAEVSGFIISLFFLAIMAPGLFLGRIIRTIRSYTNIISLCAIVIGLLCVGIFHNVGMLTIGIILAGLGYGIMQPLIYDKTAIIAPPNLATKALAIVMSANYIAIILCPFILRLLQRIFHTHSQNFPFISSAVVAAIMAIVAIVGRKNFVLGLDKSYYEQSK